jgi:hypothetical protein
MAGKCGTTLFRMKTSSIKYTSEPGKQYIILSAKCTGRKNKIGD